MPATSERVALVSWEVNNVTARRVDEYMVRVYVYRDTGEPVGFRTTRLSIPVEPGKAGSGLVKFPGEMGVRANDHILIVVTKAFFADGASWEGPLQEDVLQRVEAEVARIRGVRPVAESQPQPPSSTRRF